MCLCKFKSGQVQAVQGPTGRKSRSWKLNIFKVYDRIPRAEGMEHEWLFRE